MYKSSGVLEHGPNFRLVLNIDPQISMYYRSLIPKYKNVIPPGYSPHITIVRVHKEIPPNVAHWGKYDGKEVEFYYGSTIHYEDYFYWLNAWSFELENIREELGLPIESKYKAPSGFRKNFHCTVALDTMALQRNK